MKQNKSVKKLEVGKDYIDVNDLNIIVIDKKSDYENNGFIGKFFKYALGCFVPENWREATKEVVIQAFERHLLHRYGEDWETMKIKERHPNHFLDINDGSWHVIISKYPDGWGVWNKNGLIYRGGIWVERLEEKELEKIHIKEAIKEKKVIHCETEEEAERILGMAHELGYKWTDGEYYIGKTEWIFEKSKTCYRLLDGTHSNYDYFKKNNYVIIPSTQIADLEPEKSTDWTPAPEDIEAMQSDKKNDKCSQLKREVLTILSVESKLNPDKKISEYLEQFKLILGVL